MANMESTGNTWEKDDDEQDDSRTSGNEAKLIKESEMGFLKEYEIYSRDDQQAQSIVADFEIFNDLGVMCEE